MCAILWLLLTNRRIFSDAVKIPCHKYEIKGLGNYFERGERGEGVFLKDRLNMGARFCASTFYQDITK